MMLSSSISKMSLGMLLMASGSSVATGCTLLALGDSLADGQIAPGFVFSSGMGYNDVLFETLQECYGFDNLQYGACTGDSADLMLNGFGGTNSECTPGTSSFCYPPNTACSFFPARLGDFTSQLEGATAYIAAQPEDVCLITLSIGSNDLRSSFECGGDPTCIGNVVQQFAVNLGIIINSLVGAFGENPVPPIMAMNFYNPFLAYYLEGSTDLSLAAASDALFTAVLPAFEGIIGSLAPLGVSFVDAYTAFHGNSTEILPNGYRADLFNLCERSGMCATDGFLPAIPGPTSKKGSKKGAAFSMGSPRYVFDTELNFQDQQHPNKEGYALIGAEFVRVLEEQMLLEPINKSGKKGGKKAATP